MISTVLSVLLTFFSRAKNFLAWAAPKLAGYLLSWYGVATASFLSLSTWAFSSWDSIVDKLCEIIDGATSLLAEMTLSTGVDWLDGFIGCLSVDTLVLGLTGFVAFAFVVLSSVVIGIFLTAIGFVVQLLVTKISMSAVNNLSK